MKKIHRILLFTAVTCVLIVSATLSPVFAQDGDEPEGFENVRLWVFPEYDDPRLLVMLEGTIVGAQAPVTVRFLVPSTAEMYSAGSMDSLGQYSGGPPDREPSAISGWDEISYVVTSDIFRVEYYDPIIIGQPDKTIQYEFYGLYPISDLQVIVQEPRKSTNFNISLVGQTRTDEQGFVVHQYSYYDLDDGLSLQLDINYTKSDPNPSLSIGDDESTGSTVLVLIVIGSFVVLIAGFFGVPMLRKKTKKEQKRALRKKNAGKSIGKLSKSKYCSNCGESIEQPYPYCPHCGSAL